MKTKNVPCVSIFLSTRVLLINDETSVRTVSKVSDKFDQLVKKICEEPCWIKDEIVCLSISRLFDQVPFFYIAAIKSYIVVTSCVFHWQAAAGFDPSNLDHASIVYFCAGESVNVLLLLKVF